MRAIEFTNEEQLDELATESHRTKIKQHLIKNGYRKIGEGLGSMVFSKDAGSVIKIIFPSDINDMDNETRIFRIFHKFCQNSNSPHLPKFVSISGKHHATFVLDGEEFTMTAMEKLQPLKGMAEALVWAICENVTARLTWKESLEDMTTPNCWEYYEDDPTRMANYVEMNKGRINKEWAGFYQVCVSLYNLGRMKGFYWDLHTMNVMARGNVPVVIDPWTC